MAQKKQSPAPERGAARNVDQAGGLTHPKNSKTLSTAQALFIERRYRLAPHIAAIVAGHAFDSGARQ